VTRFLLLAAALGAAVQAVAQTPPTGIPALTTRRIVSGLSQPLFATAPVGDEGRLFVLEQNSGKIKIIDLAAEKTLSDPFLTVTGLGTGGERGLLGMAFHPQYADNGLFYVSYTDSGGTSRLREYQVSDDPNKANPDSGRDLMRVSQPFQNHNGGWIGFGPGDGYLYYALGDGGSGNDPGNRAQDITNQKLGKILRLDVSGDDFPTDANRNYKIPASNPFVGLDGDDEIWAYGVRNPWRNSFDRLTGDLYIADVGQDQREEVDFQPAASKGGENYGWRIKEGTRLTGLDLLPTTPLVDPVHEYDHSLGESITGGYVYRGHNIGGDLPGTYFFADFISSRIWSFRYEDGQKTEFTNRTAELRPGSGQSISSISSFGEDGAGNLYIVDYGGEIYKLLAVPGAADPDSNGITDLTDFGILRSHFGVGTTFAEGDFNADEQVDLTDFGILKDNFGKVSQRSGSAVPEPGGWLLLTLGAAGLVWLGRKPCVLRGVSGE
jgi:glucose/arabinose dehydrogenase